MTIEQIILLFKDIAARHKQINGFKVSEDYNLGEIDDNDFPLLAIVPTKPNLPRDVNGFSMFTMDFEIKLLDLVNDDLDNKINVYSDAVEILKDIVNEFATHPYYADNSIDIISDASMTKLDGFTDIDLYGYGTELTLASPNKISFCGSPIDNLTGYSFAVVDGKVVNTNLTYSQDVPLGQTVVLPDITHTQSDGTPTPTPAQTPFVCDAFTDVVITDANNVSSPISKGSGETYTCETLLVNEWFELEIDTTIAAETNNDQFKISVVSSFRLEVDIMDGNGSTFINGTSNSDLQLIFTFPTAGVNIIRIKGYLSMKFNTLGDSKKITDIRNWGTNVWANNNYALACENMALNISAKDTIRAVSGNLTNAFYKSSWSGNNTPIFTPTICTNAFAYTPLNANLGHWDMRTVTGMLNFAYNVTTWSQENYSNTLLGWLRWDSVTHAPATNYVVPSNIIFNGGITVGNTSTVAIGSEAELARDYLINTLNWTITDGGAV